jgi:hypothetical protein
MGYPMTLKRVVNRNGLADGDYDQDPTRSTWGRMNTRLAVDAEEMDRLRGVIPDWEPFLEKLIREWGKELNTQYGKWRSLAGDLRRLESDTVDEKSICELVAFRTHVGVDDVAAVLRAFMEA